MAAENDIDRSSSTIRIFKESIFQILMFYFHCEKGLKMYNPVQGYTKYL